MAERADAHVYPFEGGYRGGVCEPGGEGATMTFGIAVREFTRDFER